jgi:hypothetical protein
VIYLDSSVALAHLLAEDRFPAEDLWRQQLVSSPKVSACQIRGLAPLKRLRRLTSICLYEVMEVCLPNRIRFQI